MSDPAGVLWQLVCLRREEILQKLHNGGEAWEDIYELVGMGVAAGVLGYEGVARDIQEEVNLLARHAQSISGNS